MDYKIDIYFCIVLYNKNYFSKIVKILNYSYSVNKIDVEKFCIYKTKII